MTEKRFIPATHENLDELLASRIPAKTRSKQAWVMKIFRSWFQDWKVRLDDTLKVLKDLEDFDKSDLNYCLKYFVVEIRNQKGDFYPPRTLKEIIAMIQHYFQNSLMRDWSIFNDKEFQETRNILDAQMKRLASKGIVKGKKRAAPISFDEEEELWSKGILGDDSPRKLIETLIYLLGLHLSLRAAKEHRDLVFGEDSQLELVEMDGECIKYTERISKNRTYGLKHSTMDPKTTFIYPNTANSFRCPVRLYKKYITHRPETNGMKGNPSFYLAIIDNPKSNVWYKSSPLGVHSIESVVKKVMEKCGKKGFFSNTSLRRTAMTRLISGDIPDKVIQKKTGRTSDLSDRSYIDMNLQERRMSECLHGARSTLMNASSSISFDKKMNEGPKLCFNNCSFTSCQF
jgi:hypothetical protein